MKETDDPGERRRQRPHHHSCDVPNGDDVLDQVISETTQLRKSLEAKGNDANDKKTQGKSTQRSSSSSVQHSRRKESTRSHRVSQNLPPEEEPQQPLSARERLAQSQALPHSTDEERRIRWFALVGFAVAAFMVITFGAVMGTGSSSSNTASTTSQTPIMNDIHKNTSNSSSMTNTNHSTSPTGYNDLEQQGSNSNRNTYDKNNTPKT